MCLPVYGTASAESNAKKLWNCLRLEIFQPIDAETEDSALLATQVLVKTIYEGEDVQVDDVKGFARGVTQECLDILKQPEKSQARHAIKTICTLLSTTRKWRILVEQSYSSRHRSFCFEIRGRQGHTSFNWVVPKPG